MIRFSWLLLLLILGTTSAHARGADTEAQSEDPAVTLYRAGDLDGATTLWREQLETRSIPGLLEHDRDRARILYNLGNAAFRKGELTDAVGWYTAALRLRPRDGDVWANLELARSEAGLDPADRGDLTDTLARLMSSLTLAESEWLALCASLLWAALLAGEALRGGRVWRRLAFLGFGVLLCCLIPWTYNLRAAATDPVIVVNAEGAQLFSEPRGDAAVITQLDAGRTSHRLDSLPEWVKIETSGDLSGSGHLGGWVRREDVRQLRW